MGVGVGAGMVDQRVTVLTAFADDLVLVPITCT